MSRLYQALACHCSVSVHPLGVHFPMSDRSDSLSDVATTASGWSDSLGSFSMVDASPVDDPISQLERHIQYVVSGFADGNHVQMIREVMKQDQLNAGVRSQMEQDFSAQGAHWAVQRLVQHSHDALSYSLEQVLPMRRHIEDIAKLLNEMMDPEIQTDAMSLKAVMEDMHRQSDAAFKIAAVGRRKFEVLSGQLLEIQSEYQAVLEIAQKEAEDSSEVARKCQEDAEAHRRQRDVNGTVSAISATPTVGCVGGGVALLSGGATFASSIPLLGPILTCTTTSTTGWWIFSTTATVTTFNPVALGIGAGLGVICCAVALGTGSLASSASSEYQQALEKQEAAVKDADEKHLVAQQAVENKALADSMLAEVKRHERMWMGVSATGDLAAATFLDLRMTDPARRRERFNEKMHQYASDVLHFVQAIDEYLFFLHKQDFFPPTFHLQRALGQERFRKMEEDWQAAAAQVAQSTEQSELETGHGRQDEMLCC